MKSKVVILNPPSSDASYINRDLMGGMGVHVKFGKNFFAKMLSKLKANYVRIPVMQLVYAASILEKEGCSVLVIDAPNEDKKLDYVLKRIQEFGPEYVVMAVSSSCIIFERDAVAAGIKEMLPQTKIFVVGDMITEMPELLLPHFDVGIIGELEHCIGELCDGKDPELISGLLVNKGTEVKKTENKLRLSAKEQDELPFPAWHLFPYKRYRYYPMVGVDPVATIQASRGCPYGCGYCPYTKNQGRPWRARSAKSIFQEMERNVQKYGFRGFFFRDPLFTTDKQRVEKLCSLLIKSDLNVQFAFETRPELLTKELIDLLSKAGCSAINFGVEDINPEILKKISRKPVDGPLILDVITYCEDKGIRTSCFFILGLPGATKKTTEENIMFSKKLFASQIEYKVATPYPGTDLYHMAKENKWLLSESLDMLTGYTSSMQVSPELPPEYLEEKADKAFKEFYFHPKYILREIMRGRVWKNIYFALK
ncbi:MAG: radical SAM protein [Nanoarchaeota archaeon]